MRLPTSTPSRGSASRESRSPQPHTRNQSRQATRPHSTAGGSGYAARRRLPVSPTRAVLRCCAVSFVLPPREAHADEQDRQHQRQQRERQRGTKRPVEYGNELIFNDRADESAPS